MRKKYALNVCKKCKKKDWMTVTQEDRDYAENHGGLFTRLVDHGDHLLELYIDSNGAVRREYLLKKVPTKAQATASP